MRGWQALYAHVWAANNMRAMPENEIPPASPGDYYFSLQGTGDREQGTGDSSLERTARGGNGEL